MDKGVKSAQSLLPEAGDRRASIARRDIFPLLSEKNRLLNRSKIALEFVLKNAHFTPTRASLSLKIDLIFSSFFKLSDTYYGPPPFDADC